MKHETVSPSYYLSIMPKILYALPFIVKAYGELPENAKINETDTYGEEDGECTFEFGVEADKGEDESGSEIDIDDI